MKKILSIATLLACTLTTTAQTDVKLTINHLLGSAEFAMNTEAQNDIGEEIKIQRLEYYISGISITHDGGQTTNASNVYILAQAERTDTILLGNFDITSVEAISFSIGVDPLVNNNDPTAWPTFHPLAPKAPSMHWGWASGYRFVALEGRTGTDFTQDFQIHALGNKNYFRQSIPTSAASVDGDLVVTLRADYTKAIAGMNMSSGLIEHGEDREAADCLRNFQTTVFTSVEGEGNTLSSPDMELQDIFTVHPVPSSGTVHLTLIDATLHQGQVVVTDLAGKVVYTNTLQASEEFTLAEKGLYFLTVYGDGVKSTKKLIIE